MVEQNPPQASETIDLFVRPEAARRVNRVFLVSLLAGVALLAALTLQVKPFGSRGEKDGEADSHRSPLPMNLDRRPDSYARLQEPPPRPPEPEPEPTVTKPVVPPTVEPKPVVRTRIMSPRPAKKPDPYEEAFKAGFFWQEEPGSKRQPATTSLTPVSTREHDPAGLQDRLRTLGQLDADTHAADATQAASSPARSAMSTASSVATAPTSKPASEGSASSGTGSSFRTAAPFS
jgi:hypothetical protein